MLSPLLFNLIGEVLASLLKIANRKNMFQGITPPNSLLELTHLQFADDVILFIKDDTLSIKAVKRTLQCFEILSGLHINYNKSYLYGFKESQTRVAHWAGLLECQTGSENLTYLGATIVPSPSLFRF